MIQALANRGTNVGKTVPRPARKATFGTWQQQLLIGIGIGLVTLIRSEQGRQVLMQYGWVLAAVVLWLAIYESAERLGLWHVLRGGDPRPLERWQKSGLSGLYAFVGSWLVYRFLLQPNKETWMLVGALALIALVFFSAPLHEKYGWVGLGAVMYLVFFSFSADLITGAQWNFVRFLVAAVALLIAGLFAPLTSGDPALAVCIGCWVIAFGVWWIRGWFLRAAS